MAGWGSWMTSVVSSAAGEVAQFGAAALDSVTAIDEPEQDLTSPNTDGARALEGESGERTADAAEEASHDGGERPEKAETGKAHAPEGEGWVPKELRFATDQGSHLLHFGAALVEKGAEVALAALPDEQDARPTNAAPAATEAPAAAQSVAPAAGPTAEERLRIARGEWEALRRARAADSPAVAERCAVISAAALDTVDPTEVVDFEGSPDPAWIADTMAGRQLRLAVRSAMAVTGDDGEPLRGEALIAGLGRLAPAAHDGAEVAVNIVLDALAARFVDAAVADDDWCSPRAAEPDAAAKAEQLALATLALCHFTHRELEAGYEALGEMAAAAAQYARRELPEEAKAVKERSLGVRADCYVEIADTLGRLEESLECVAALMPPAVGLREALLSNEREVQAECEEQAEVSRAVPEEEPVTEATAETAAAEVAGTDADVVEAEETGEVCEAPESAEVVAPTEEAVAEEAVAEEAVAEEAVAEEAVAEEAVAEEAVAEEAVAEAVAEEAVAEEAVAEAVAEEAVAEEAVAEEAVAEEAVAEAAVSTTPGTPTPGSTPQGTPQSGPADSRRRRRKKK